MSVGWNDGDATKTESSGKIFTYWAQVLQQDETVKKDDDFEEEDNHEEEE